MYLGPACMPLLKPAHLLISERTSHLHGYKDPLLLGTTEYTRKINNMYLPLYSKHCHKVGTIQLLRLSVPVDNTQLFCVFYSE